MERVKKTLEFLANKTHYDLINYLKAGIYFSDKLLEKCPSSDFVHEY
jgi:hypothetical protein